MKLTDLFEARSKVIKTPHAYLSYSWKPDLLDEENEDYLPLGYNPKKVLYLDVIHVLGASKGAPQRKGYGTEIMKKFLATPDAKKAELIYLDLNPFTGEERVNHTDYKRQEEIKDGLEIFYKKFGFRNRRRHGRMWLVQKGEIPTNQLPE